MWTSYDGREVLIKDLDTAHFVNMLNWVKTNMKEGYYSQDFMDFLEVEANIRILEGFAAGAAFPRKLKTGYWELANLTRLRKFVDWIKLKYYHFQIKRNA